MSNYRVQRGVAVFGASSDTTTVTLTNAVDRNRAIPFLTNTQNSGSGRDTADLVVLSNDDLGATIAGWSTGASFTITRESTGENSDHRYNWEVWEDLSSDQAADGWVLHGIKVVALNVGQSFKASSAFSAITTNSQCIPIILGIRSERTLTAWGEARVSIKMQANGTIRLDRDALSTFTVTDVSVAVLEMGSNWIVKQNLEADYDVLGGLDREISGAGASEPWANKFISSSVRIGSGGFRIREITFMVRPKSGDNDLILVRSDPTNTTIPPTPSSIVCHTAYHPDMTVEHRSTVDDGLTTLSLSSVDQDLAAATSLSETGLIASVAIRGGFIYPGGHWSYNLKDNDTITFRRGGFLQSGGNFAYQAIRFPHIDESGGDSIMVTASAGSTGLVEASADVGSTGASGSTRESMAGQSVTGVSGPGSRT